MFYETSRLVSVATVLWASVVAAQDTKTSAVDVARAAATARTNSPTSSISGLAFDRIAIIWLENTDYAKAVGDRMCSSAGNSTIVFKSANTVMHCSQPRGSREKGDYTVKLLVGTKVYRFS